MFAISDKKLHRRCLTGFQMCLRLKVLQLQDVGRLQIHGICGRRLVYREVLEARSNYITAWGDWTGSDLIEKERIRLPPGLTGGKWGEGPL